MKHEIIKELVLQLASVYFFFCQAEDGIRDDCDWSSDVCSSDLELTRSASKTKAILLTRHDEDQYVIEALRAGVKGYVLKSQAVDDLLHAIGHVCGGKIYLRDRESVVEGKRGDLGGRRII